MLLANLRFLAGYRRPGLLPEQLLEDVLAAVRPGDTIGRVISRLSGASDQPKVNCGSGWTPEISASGSIVALLTPG